MRNENVTGFDGLAISGIQQHALAAYPNECCGILFGHRDISGEIRVSDAIPLANKADAKETDRHFLADPMMVWQLEKAGIKRGLEIVGIYHSHPDAPAELSGEDEEWMLPDQLYAVISIFDGKCGEIRFWKRNDTEHEPEEVAC